MVLERLARNHQDSWARRPHGRRQERRVVAAAFVGMAPDQVRVASTRNAKPHTCGPASYPGKEEDRRILDHG
jgi:hypothetical protein